MSIRIAINGFGRIGRSVFRAALDPKNKDIEIILYKITGQPQPVISPTLVPKHKAYTVLSPTLV